MPNQRVIIVGIALLAAAGAAGGIAWRHQQRLASTEEDTTTVPTASTPSPPLESENVPLARAEEASPALKQEASLAQEEAEEEEDEPLELEEARLVAYLDVREAALGAWRPLEKEQPEALAASLAKARAQWVAQLEQRGMSPTEFAAHTVELYGPRAKDSKPLSAEELESLEGEIISTESDAVKEAGDELSEEEEAAHEAFQEAAQEKLDLLVRQRTLALNAALRTRHAERIGVLANPGFDSFARTRQ